MSWSREPCYSQHTASSEQGARYPDAPCSAPCSAPWCRRAGCHHCTEPWYLRIEPQFLPRRVLWALQCAELFVQCTEPWDPALPQPASEKGSHAQGLHFRPSSPCPGPCKLVRTKLFLAFLSLFTSCEPLELHFCLLKLWVWVPVGWGMITEPV